MKKTLLFGASALLACSALAQGQNPITDPVVVYDDDLYNGYLINMLSPNGQWGVSECYGVLAVFDFVNDTRYIFEPETQSDSYSMGFGTCISNDGVLTLTTSYNIMKPMYWENGEIIELPINAQTEKEGLANGITPDASRICGTVMRSNWTSEDRINQIPVVWNRNSEGVYDLYVELPYPKKDIFGATPQSVTALCISQDGKTVAGQVRSGSGWYHSPIVFREDADGNWSYEVLGEELIITHPEIELPEDPGESPQHPEATDYMTEEMAAQYEADCAAWSIGEPYPKSTDYMTAEAAQRYLSDYAAAQAAIDEWNEKYYEYQRVFHARTEGCAQFDFNSCYLSADGRYMVGNHLYLDSWENIEEIYPVIFNLQNGTYEKRNSENQYATFVNSTGVALTTNSIMNYFMRNVYVSTPGGNYTPLQDWVKGINADLYDWMDENMRHDYDSYDMETGQAIRVENGWLTGSATATPDMSLIATEAMNIWDEYEIPYYSYLLPVRSEISKVNNFAGKNTFLGVNASKGGIVNVTGDAASLEVLDLAGRTLFTASNPSGSIATGLSNGIYMLKATAPDGKTIVKKACF